MTPLVALALELSDRLESGTGLFEVDLLLLGRSQLLGTSFSLTISLLLD